MDMSVPPQVQHQMDQAQALHSDLYGAKETPAPAENTPDPVAEAPIDAAPEPTVTPEAPVTQVSDDFKHKYDVLRGKFDAEVPRLHAQLKERDALMQQMSERLAALEKSPEPEKKESLVTEKDVEDFGTDLVDMARRAAREEFRQESKTLIAAIDQRFNVFQQHLGTMQAKVVESEADTFWNRVMSVVPDWKAVDENPQWIEFLDSRIPGTKKTRRQEAADAIADGDHALIKELVDIWRGDSAVTKRTEQNKQNQADLQRQVAPSTAKASAPPNQLKVWTAAEYEYIFSQKASQDMPEAKLSAMQADAQQAVTDGRIRW